MKRDGGPAFPESYSGNDAPYNGIGGGMTLRDYFAAAVLTGVFANERLKSGEAAATLAYAVADAMLSERDK